MAPVKINYIVSFTSQDENHKANNLITGDGIKKWLCNPKDRSGKIEITIQLEQATQFTYIDIGTLWCASLEIRAGKSDWPQTTEFKTLVPMVNLMSPIDCQLGRKITNTQMFTTKDFSNTTACQKWDRLQVICRQPYRKDMQLGISFIRIRNSGQVTLTSTASSSKTDEVVEKGRRILDIKRHFFGESLENKGDEVANLKNRLLQISSSSDNGCDNLHQEALSRTAQLVIKASEKTTKSNAHYNIQSKDCKRGLFSDAKTNKNGMVIEEEMAAFFPTLNLTSVDIDLVTVADLRHKFERKKRRKLSIEEKRKFSEQCQEFIWNLSDPCSFENQNSFTNGKVSSPPPATVTKGAFLHHCATNTARTDFNSDKPISSSSSYCSPTSLKNISSSNTKSRSAIKISPAATLRKKTNIPQNEIIQIDGDSKESRGDNRFKKRKNNSSSKLEPANNDDINSDICYDDSNEDNDDNDSISIDDSSPSRKPQIKRKLQTLEDVNKSYQDLYKTFSPPENIEQDRSISSSSAKRKKLNQNSKKLIHIFDSELSDNEEEKNTSVTVCTSSSSTWLNASKKSGEHNATPKSNSKFQWKLSKTPASKNGTASFRNQWLSLVQSNQIDETNKGTGSSLLCKSCGFLIPQDTYDAHCSACFSQPKSHGKANAVNKGSSSRQVGLVKEAKFDLTTPSAGNQVVDLTEDYTQCPICLQQFPQEVLMVHASDCGL